MNKDIYQSSYWEKTSFLRPADVGIVGGGLTGLQTALKLKQHQPGLDVLLLERAAFSRGASTRNAGFACFGSPTELIEDLENNAAAEVWDTVARRYAGIRRLEQEHGAFIDYEKNGGYELFFDQSRYQNVLEALPVINAEFRRICGQSNVWASAKSANNINSACSLVYNDLEGQLHPGKLVEKLVHDCQHAGVRLLFGLNVEAVGQDQGRYYMLTEGSESPLYCQQLVVATNAFAKDLLPELPIEPARNQVLITEPIKGLKLRGCFHHERGYVYFRNVGNERLLIGGARHLAGKASETSDFGSNPQLEQELMDILSRCVMLPEGQSLKLAGSWSGIIAQGGKSPLVQRTKTGIVVAARLAGMGVALSAQLAEEAAVLVLS